MCHKQAVIFGSRHRFCLSSDCSHQYVLLEGNEAFRTISAAHAEHGHILIVRHGCKNSLAEGRASAFYLLKLREAGKPKSKFFFKASGLSCGSVSRGSCPRAVLISSLPVQNLGNPPCKTFGKLKTNPSNFCCRFFLLE